MIYSSQRLFHLGRTFELFAVQELGFYSTFSHSLLKTEEDFVQLRRLRTLCIRLFWRRKKGTQSKEDDKGSIPVTFLGQPSVLTKCLMLEFSSSEVPSEPFAVSYSSFIDLCSPLRYQLLYEFMNWAIDLRCQWTWNSLSFPYFFLKSFLPQNQEVVIDLSTPTWTSFGGLGARIPSGFLILHGKLVWKCISELLSPAPYCGRHFFNIGED